MATKKAEPEGVLRVGVNGYTLNGVKEGGRWVFTCPDFPGLEMRYGGTGKYRGTSYPGTAVTEFVQCALAVAPKTAKG